MKSAILYATTTRPAITATDYRLIIQRKGRNDYRIWVRTVIIQDDVGAALDKAKPRPGEIVLNTIPLP